MPDLSHNFGADLAIGPTGDLALVSDAMQVQQRVLRRLLTAPGAYIWQPNYGAGLPAMVGDPANAQTIAGAIQAQMMLEADVAQSPPPAVTVQVQPNGTVTATVQYADAATRQTQTLNLPLG